MTQSRVVVAG